MVIPLGKFVIAVLVTQVISFVLTALLYMNPPVSKLYKKYEKHTAMKQGESRGKWMSSMFILTLIEVFFAGLIFFIAADVLPGSGWQKGLFFGLLLAGVRVFGRFTMMYMLTSYPNSLLKVEFVNGIIDCLIIGLCFSYFISISDKLK